MPSSVSTRSYKAIVLIALNLVVSHLWLIWEKDFTIIRPYPFAKDYALNVHWYVSFLGSAVASVLVAGAFMIVSRMNQVVKAAAIIYFIYTVIDLLMLILWGSILSYTLVFASMILVTAIVLWYMFGRSSQRYLSETKHIVMRHNRQTENA